MCYSFVSTVKIFLFENWLKSLVVKEGRMSYLCDDSKQILWNI